MLEDSVFSKLSPPEGEENKTVGDRIEDLKTNVEGAELEGGDVYDYLLSLLETINAELIEFDEDEEVNKLRLHVRKSINIVNQIKFREEQKNAKG